MIAGAGGCRRTSFEYSCTSPQSQVTSIEPLTDPPIRSSIVILTAVTHPEPRSSLVWSFTLMPSGKRSMADG